MVTHGLLLIKISLELLLQINTYNSILYCYVGKLQKYRPNEINNNKMIAVHSYAYKGNSF